MIDVRHARDNHELGIFTEIDIAGQAVNSDEDHTKPPKKTIHDILAELTLLLFSAAMPA